MFRRALRDVLQSPIQQGQAPKTFAVFSRPPVLCEHLVSVQGLTPVPIFMH